MTDAAEGKYPETEFQSVGTSQQAEEDIENDHSDAVVQTRLAEHVERVSSFNAYDGEGLNYLESLRTPLSADDLITMIQEAKFLRITTQSLINTIKTHISTDALLSQTEEGGNAELYFDIIMTEVTALCPLCDTTRPEYVVIKSNMKSCFLYELSRTRGAYRERRLQDPNRMEIVTGKLTSAQQNTKPRISLPGFRGR